MKLHKARKIQIGLKWDAHPNEIYSEALWKGRGAQIRTVVRILDDRENKCRSESYEDMIETNFDYGSK